MVFGINLATTPQKGGNMLYYLVPIVTAILQYFQVQTATPAMAPTSSIVKVGDDKDKKNDGGDFQKAMNTQMKYIFPLMIGWFSMSMPLGLSLYWNIFSLFSIIQYKRIGKKIKI